MSDPSQFEKFDLCERVEDAERFPTMELATAAWSEAVADPGFGAGSTMIQMVTFARPNDAGSWVILLRLWGAGPAWVFRRPRGFGDFTP